MVETGYGGHFGVSVPVFTREGDSFMDFPAEGFEPPHVPPSEATHAYVASATIDEKVRRLGSGARLGIEVTNHNGVTGSEIIVSIRDNRGVRVVRM